MTWEAAEGTVANMVTRPGYQLADVQDTPLSPEVLGTDTKTGNGRKFGSSFVSIASTTQARQYFRAGVWVKNPTGTQTLNVLLLWLEVEIEDD